MSDGEALPSQEQRGRVFRTEVSAGLPVQLLQELTCACNAKTIRAPVGRPLVESEGMEGGSSGTSGSRVSQTSAHAHRWLCFGPPRRASRPAGETPEVREASTEQTGPPHFSTPSPLQAAVPLGLQCHRETEAAPGEAGVRVSASILPTRIA